MSKLKNIEVEFSEEDIIEMIKEVVWRRYFLNDPDVYYDKLKVRKKNQKYIASTLK